eukprot:10753164-Lingulodinium_polyedra.AAC.1
MCPTLRRARSHRVARRPVLRWQSVHRGPFPEPPRLFAVARDREGLCEDQVKDFDALGLRGQP